MALWPIILHLPGKRILILERGDYVPREKANWDPQVVNVDAHYNTKETWLDKDGKDLHPHTNYYVGGNTKFYGAALFRLRKEDFGEIRHYGGISPAWPISYDDLEPYYTEAEKLYHVHGTRGEDPTEPPASGPYPWPAVSHEPRIQQLAEDFAQSGLKPFQVPLGIQLDEKNPIKSRCIRCNTCDGFPCLVSAKADAQVLCVDEAVKYPNVTLLTNSLVKRLETDPTGREVKSVVVERDGALESYSADLVVVSAGAINSAALLLRSADDKHPRGLANSSDVVGRHYMGHTNSVLMAISKCPNPSIFQKTLAVNDFYFGSEDWPYPMGHISFVGKLDAVTLRAGAPAIAPNFTLELMAQHSLDFWLTSEDLPDPNNRVTVDHNGKIVLTYTPNNLEAHERLTAKLKHAMKQQICADSWARLSSGTVCAQLVCRPAHSPGGRGPSERHHSLRARPQDVGAGRELQSARRGQPLRRRWQLLPLECRRQSCADHHRKRAACRRSSSGAHGCSSSAMFGERQTGSEVASAV